VNSETGASGEIHRCSPKGWPSGRQARLTVGANDFVNLLHDCEQVSSTVRVDTARLQLRSHREAWSPHEVARLHPQLFLERVIHVAVLLLRMSFSIFLEQAYWDSGVAIECELIKSERDCFHSYVAPSEGAFCNDQLQPTKVFGYFRQPDIPETAISSSSRRDVVIELTPLLNPDEIRDRTTRQGILVNVEGVNIGAVRGDILDIPLYNQVLHPIAVKINVGDPIFNLPTRLRQCNLKWNKQEYDKLNITAHKSSL